MKFKKTLASSAIALATTLLSANIAYAACATDNLPGTMAKPDGYPARALTMVVPYGPAGGSGQVAQAMAQAVSDLTDVSINRDQIDSYFMASVTAGVSSDSWTAELYVNNLTDERAEVSRNFVFDVRGVTYVQPRTIGVRMSVGF